MGCTHFKITIFDLDLLKLNLTFLIVISIAQKVGKLQELGERREEERERQTDRESEREREWK